MAIHDQTTQFFGRPVANYSREQGLSDPKGHAYRIFMEYDEVDEEEDDSAEPGKSGFLSTLTGRKTSAKPLTFAEKFTRMTADPNCSQIEALLVGGWGDAYDNTSAVVVEALVAARDRLPSLRALFIGDMTSEECEISWIRQSDISSLYAVYPKLEWLQIRGGDGLELGRSMELPNLRGLVIEAGGMGASVLKSLSHARLPALEHLELWLGTDEYGWDGGLEDIDPLLREVRFPKLRYLGLRNFEQIDELAPRLVDAPVMKGVETLDLSLGNLSDEGGAELLKLARGGSLKHLDLHHHYLSEGMMKSLSALPFNVNLDERCEPDDWGDGKEHRYIAVSE